jgi:hypothetical protein
MGDAISSGTTVLEREVESPARRHISETELMAVPPAASPRRISRVPAPRRRGRRVALLVVIGLSLIGGTYAVVHANDQRVSFGAFEGY